MKATNSWIAEYISWQGYDLEARVARAIYPTSIWTGHMSDVQPMTAQKWASWLLAALRHGRDL